MENLIESYRAQVRRIQAASARIYGDSETGRALAWMCGTVLGDLDDIEDHRGVEEAFVAVIGHKNAGKSTLCRLFVEDDEKRGRIRAGVGEKGKHATTRITWIGPGVPLHLERGVESSVPVGREGMTDLGVPYSLVDVPGFSDESAAARKAAERALRMSGTAIVVWSFGQWEDESVLDYLRLCDGARLIPVVVGASYQAKLKDGRMRGELESLRQRLELWCPKSEVLTPVLIPMLKDASDTENRKELEAIAREKVSAVLAEQLRQPSPDPVRLADGRCSRFLDELAEELGPFLDRVREPYSELVDQEEESVRSVSEQLTGNPRQLRAGIRLRMLAALMDECPVIFFPFRSFLGLLTLVAGAWDRLILGLLGSIPSLAVTVLQSGKNAAQLAKNRQAAREELRQKATSLATGKLARVNRKFLSAIREALPDEAKSRFDYISPETELEGLDEVESEAEKIFDKLLEDRRPRGVVIFVLGLLSMLVWIGLAAGPIWSIYNEFFQAWGIAFDGSQPGKWNEFPVPSGGMIFSTLLLTFGPVFLMAMVALGLSVTPRRVNRCAEAVWAETNMELDTFIKTGLIHLKTDDEMRNAVRTLLEELSCDRNDSSGKD